jgi:prophage antirepressor-like protein
LNDLAVIKGVECYIGQDGIVQLNLEQVARGLGFTQIKGEVEYVRWETVKGYLAEFRFSQEVGKEKFIPENIFYRLAMKAKNETAEKFQATVADEILPTIRKTGGYIANDDLFISTYLPFADESTKVMFRGTLETVRKQNELIVKQQKELQYKEDVIIGLVDDVELAEKRQVLNRVVRYKNANFQQRWQELYKQFEMKYHIDLNLRLIAYNSVHKPKLKSKIDYIDKVMNKVPELYEIACKLYENDIKELTEQMYKLNKTA